MHARTMYVGAMYVNPVFSLALSTLTRSQLSSTPFTDPEIKALVQHSHYVEALSLYTPVSITKFTFPSLLKACASLPSLRCGKTVHSAVLALGLQHDAYIANSLIDMYVKCGSLDDAVKVFEEFTQSEELAQDAIIWRSMIYGYLRNGHLDEGISQFGRMQAVGVRPDKYSLLILLGACDGLPRSLDGRQIHSYVVRNDMFHGDTCVQTALIDMYLRSRRPMDALVLFDHLEHRINVVPWNVMISGLSENGFWWYSLEFYSGAKNENVNLVSASFASTLSACCSGEDVGFGRQVHCDVIKMGFRDDPYVSTAILIMYGKCRSVDDAKRLFTLLEHKEIESWNAMISAYVSNGHFEDALEVYSQMRLGGISPDSITLLNVLTSCQATQSQDFGQSIHAYLIKRPLNKSVALQSSLLTMYSRCGSIQDATLVFSCMNERNVVAWGSMISGFSQNGKCKEALDFFEAMEADGFRPDSYIMVSVLEACAALENISLGCQIHGRVIKSGVDSNTFVASSLIDMYSKCRLPDIAAAIFSSMPHKSLESCNSMLSCYHHNDLPELSINLLSQIVELGVYPDSVSIKSVVKAISSLASLLKGKTIHACLIRHKIPQDVQMGNALIDMYSRAGCIDYAQRIFQNMPKRNLITWTLMISSYGFNGHSLKSLGLFDEMRSLGVAPDLVTFMSLISSCRHSGMVEEGLRLLHLMKEEYHIEPEIETYVNIVDLLGRAGRLDDAYHFIQSMSMAPDRNVWQCLLSACRIHKNVKLGEMAASNLLRIEPDAGSHYFQLFKLYGEAEMQDRALQLRAYMKENGLNKNPGCSWIELKDGLNVFYSGGSTLSSTGEICNTLTNLNRNIGKSAVDEELIGAF